MVVIAVITTLIIAVIAILGGTLIRRYGGLYNVLKSVYPEHVWQPERFGISSLTSGSKKSQYMLSQLIQELFQNSNTNYNTRGGTPSPSLPSQIEILYDYKHPKMEYRASGKKMELDVYIPALRLGFEYQGKHHFQVTYPFGGKLSSYLDINLSFYLPIFLYLSFSS